MAKSAGGGSGDHHPGAAGGFFAGLIRAIPISIVLWGGIAWLFGFGVMCVAVVVLSGAVGTIAIWGLVSEMGVPTGTGTKGGSGWI